MTTTSEHDAPARAADPDPAGAGNNLEKVRDLLFGGQMRDYERKFARLEARLVQEATDVREEVKKRLTALEAYMRAEVESLSERLRTEQEARAGAAQDLGRELRDTAQQFAQRAGQIDDVIARNQRELRQQLHAQHQELGDDIRRRVEEVLARLAHEAQELRGEKTDRRILAALLTDMALRLGGELPAAAAGDAVGV